ncbi:MAG: TIGR00730 family Rossman fold protein [Sphingobacteriaceae bacterium]|nr:TIGR00730 family Rossman fold protein [Sphingobacteriaceae bacterium]
MPTNIHTEEKKFLAGPRTRWEELKYAISVFSELITGLRKLHFIGPCVTVFGSARFKEDHQYYKLTREVSQEIAKLGFAIMTGGGPGIMEAANRGAKDVGGLSIGCNILLPKEQQHNAYLDSFVTLDHFFVRKELLRKYSFAFIVMPGGFGTLDEFFEALTLVQTRKIEKFPIVIMGIDYHKDLHQHIHRMALEQTINEEDMELILFTDSIKEAVHHIRKHSICDFNLKLKKAKKAMWILGEKPLKQ